MNTKAKDWLSRKEAAIHLTALGYPISPKTLANLASKSLGPPYRLVMGRWTSYNREQLEKWAAFNTSEYGDVVQPTTGALTP